MKPDRHRAVNWLTPNGLLTTRQLAARARTSAEAAT